MVDISVSGWILLTSWQRKVAKIWLILPFIVPHATSGETLYGYSWGSPHIPIVENGHLQSTRVSTHNRNAPLKIQGSSNMTGTVYTCLHTNQSRPYLNHLVFTVAKIFSEQVLCRKVKHSFHAHCTSNFTGFRLSWTRGIEHVIFALCVPFVTCKSACLYVLHFALFQTYVCGMPIYYYYYFFVAWNNFEPFTRKPGRFDPRLKVGPVF